MHKIGGSYSGLGSQCLFCLLAWWLSVAALTTYARPATGAAGRIVWWGQDDFWRNYHSTHTNGLAEIGDEFVSNTVAIKLGMRMGLALKSDGTVAAFGADTLGVSRMPANLTNIASVAIEGDRCWAIRRNGTVVCWPQFWNNFTPEPGDVVSRLTNVTSVCWAGANRFLALRKDGTLVGINFDNPAPLRPTVQVHGTILSNVVAIAAAGHTPLVLLADGTVYHLSYQTSGKPPVEPRYEARDNVLYEYLGAESAAMPYGYAALAPVIINGVAVSNVVAIAGGGTHELALKKDGTIVAWGTDTYGAAVVPPGLDHVKAIAASQNQSMALKQDGTVVAWGNDYFKQTSVPASLSNVVAIAAGYDFHAAITTGAIPPSVYIRPHGRIEELEQQAELVFKGEAIANTRITNAAFRISSMAVEATQFKVISVLKGPALREVTFLHYADYAGPSAWSGPSPPAMMRFQPGEHYLVFAASLDQADAYYIPAAGTPHSADEFRQIADVPKAGNAGILKTLDGRKLTAPSIKEAHWLELNRLLKDSNPTNVLSAISRLDGMSVKGEPYEEWRRSSDFKRARVLAALLPLTYQPNVEIATHALACFELGTNASALLPPFTNRLVKIANQGPTSAHRLAAIRALSGLDGEAVTNSLVALLTDTNETIRAGAFALLPRFPVPLAEGALTGGALNSSPKVRAAVADTIGAGNYATLIPVLETLWLETNAVHTSAGNALLKFELPQVEAVLRKNLAAEDFRTRFLCKLAANNPQPWLTNLVDVLKVRREKNWEAAKSSGIKETTNYFHALMALSGDNFECWNLIHDYLVKLPAAEFQNGQLDWCLDVLEDAGNTGSREPVMLYELYKSKGLTERAARFRRENGKCSGFDVTIYFDRSDGK